MTIKKWIGEKYKTLKDSIQRFMDWKFFRLFLLLTVAVIEVFLIIILWDKIDNFIKCNQIHKDWLKAVIPLLIAAPVALLIWYWRDQNKRADIENDRSVILQKEFHQIEQWATNLKEDVLQLAAIHQLNPYATGKNGKDFQKPASEIYKALLSAWGEQIKDESEKYLKENGERPTLPDELKPPPHIKAIHKIVKKDWKKFPDDFLPGIYLGYADLFRANFKEANLMEANLDAADLRDTDLSGAKLEFAKLRRAKLEDAKLEGSKLIRTKLMGANLYKADLRNANFETTKLQEADLRNANLAGAEFLGDDLGSYLKKAKFFEANFAGATFILVDFEGVSLVGTNLVGANLKKTHLDGAKLNGAEYSKDTKGMKDTQFPEGFDPKEHGMVLMK